MAPPVPIRTYIALGANLGERERNLRAALKLIDDEPAMRTAAVSAFVENRAVGGPPGSPPFLNAAAAVDTTLSPRQVLNCLLDIERQLGRERRERWGPRNIDLDLLLYGQEIIHEPGLTVPHPLMAQRRFVLEPLAQIAPDVVHPLLHASVADLLRACAVPKA